MPRKSNFDAGAGAGRNTATTSGLQRHTVTSTPPPPKPQTTSGIQRHTITPSPPPPSTPSPQQTQLSQMQSWRAGERPKEGGPGIFDVLGGAGRIVARGAQESAQFSSHLLNYGPAAPFTYTAQETGLVDVPDSWIGVASKAFGKKPPGWVENPMEIPANIQADAAKDVANITQAAPDIYGGARHAVTNPTSVARGVKETAQTIKENPALLGTIGTEVAKSFLDPKNLIWNAVGVGVAGAVGKAAKTGERAAAAARAVKTTEEVAEGATKAGRLASSVEGFDITAEKGARLVQRARTKIGLKPQSVTQRGRSRAADFIEGTARRGRETGPTRQIVADIVRQSPFRPEGGAAEPLRTAVWRAGQVGKWRGRARNLDIAGDVAGMWNQRDALTQRAAEIAQGAQGQSWAQQAKTAFEQTGGMDLSLGQKAMGAGLAASMLAPLAAKALGSGGTEKPEEPVVPDEEEAVMEMGEFTKLGPRTDNVPGRGQTPIMPPPQRATAAPGVQRESSPLMEGIAGYLKSAGSGGGGGFMQGQAATFGAGEANRFYIQQTQIGRGPTTSRFGRAAGQVGREYMDRYDARKQAKTAAARRQERSQQGRPPTGSALPPPLPPAGPKGLPGSKPAKYGNLTPAGRKPYASLFGGQTVGPAPQAQAAATNAQAVASTINTSTGKGSYANRGAPANPRQMAFDFGTGEVETPLKPEQLTLGI